MLFISHSSYMLSMAIQPRIPSNKKLHLILYMKNNGNIITFKTQQIYRHNISFKRAMKELHDKKVVLFRQLRKGNEYKLTDFGEVVGMCLNELAE